jgi:hypothetical protein
MIIELFIQDFVFFIARMDQDHHYLQFNKNLLHTKQTKKRERKKREIERFSHKS